MEKNNRDTEQQNQKQEEASTQVKINRCEECFDIKICLYLHLLNHQIFFLKSGDQVKKKKKNKKKKTKVKSEDGKVNGLRWDSICLDRTFIKIQQKAVLHLIF